MKNLSECTYTFSGAMLARQAELDSCKTVAQVQLLVHDIIENTKNLSKEAKAYGEHVFNELRLHKKITGALIYMYNIILAGDSEGLLHTEDAKHRKRGAKAL